MEKTISAEERIRRAEEIYARRKNANMGTSIPYARVNVAEKKKSKPLRKMLIQICICIAIYVAFYTVKSGNYIFSGDLTNNIRNILEYDISIQGITDNILNYINKQNNVNAEIPEENKAETYEEGLTEGVSEEITTQTDTLGVTDEVLFTEESSSISQVQIDANYIKENHSFIKPLNGTITSRFGTRNPTNPKVPKYHTGIDIAANTGTKIIAAMEGEVVLVSSQGDYR